MCPRGRRVRLVRPGASWGSLGLYGFVGFVQVRLGGRWVRFGLSGSSLVRHGGL